MTEKARTVMTNSGVDEFSSLYQACTCELSAAVIWGLDPPFWFAQQAILCIRSMSHHR